MAVPPPSQPSGTSPSSSGRNEPEESKRSKKEFKLPDKKQEKQDQGSGAETGVKELKQSVEDQKKAELTKASEVQSSQAQAAVKAVGQLIQRMVSEMRVGENFANMTLSKGDVPEAFQGSNLTISYQENALVIRFDNFMTPQQENNALTLVEKNKEQLQEMLQTLQAKNITVHELSIGNQKIALPRVEALPPPFQAAQPSGAETRRDQQQQQQGGGGGEEGAGR